MIRFWVDVAIRVSVIIAGMGASTALVPPAGGTIIELVAVVSKGAKGRNSRTICTRYRIRTTHCVCIPFS